MEPKKNEKWMIIEDAEYFASQQRSAILRQLFDNKYKCRICKAKKDIQIHHLYGYAPSNNITTYEDFLLIPWVPLCKKCHVREHMIPEVEDD